MKWKRTNPEPTPEQLAAWADGELDRSDAERVEAWLAARPDSAREVEAARRLGHLYRDHPPPEPSERAWQATLAGIEAGLSRPVAPTSSPGFSARWRLRLFVGLVAAAAVVGGVLVARVFSPEQTPEPEYVELPKPEPKPVPQPEEPDEPFPVVPLGEVNIISIDAEDADRVVIGQSLMGEFELAASDDIDIVKMEPCVEDGQMPHLHRGEEVPMIVVAKLGNRDR
jgi:hypothetical protein